MNIEKLLEDGSEITEPDLAFAALIEDIEHLIELGFLAAILHEPFTNEFHDLVDFENLFFLLSATIEGSRDDFFDFFGVAVGPPEVAHNALEIIAGDEPGTLRVEKIVAVFEIGFLHLWSADSKFLRIMGTYVVIFGHETFRGSFRSDRTCQSDRSLQFDRLSRSHLAKFKFRHATLL